MSQINIVLDRQQTIIVCGLFYHIPCVPLVVTGSWITYLKEGWVLEIYLTFSKQIECKVV